MPGTIRHSEMMRRVMRVKESGGRVKYDRECGLLDAFDRSGKRVIQATQSGGPKAGWVEAETKTMQCF